MAELDYPLVLLDRVRDEERTAGWFDQARARVFDIGGGIVVWGIFATDPPSWSLA